MDETILVSIIIPVKNGDPWLEETIPAILNQRINGYLEIIVLDSGSTDNTKSILSKYPVKAYDIDPTQFNHGLTRNLGANLASGKYIAFTVQDASPVNEYWLQNMLAPFEDNMVVGVCGSQIVPHQFDKNPIEWYRPISAHNINFYQFPSKNEFEILSPELKRQICSWDNVNAVYRKDFLKMVPFQDVSFGEDALWARDALLNGAKIAYTSFGQVYHYHYELPSFTFKRAFTENYHRYLFFEVLPTKQRSELIMVLSNLKVLIMIKGLSLFRTLFWIIYNYRKRKAIRKANRIFNFELKKGISALEIAHNSICDKIPQAVKPKFK